MRHLRVLGRLYGVRGFLHRLHVGLGLRSAGGSDPCLLGALQVPQLLPVS